MTDEQIRASANVHKRGASVRGRAGDRTGAGVDPAADARAEVAAAEVEPDSESPDGDEATSPAIPDPLLARIVAEWPSCAWDVQRGQRVVIVPPGDLQAVAEWLRVDGFTMCVDVTGVDYLDHWDRALGTWDGEPTRFEVVVNLVNMTVPSRLRLRVPVDEDELSCPTLSFIWPSADPHEREVFDMFGIVFEGHPDLVRILMPDEWDGHPLRKDYDQGRIPVTFKEGNPEVTDGGPVPQPVTFKGLRDKGVLR